MNNVIRNEGARSIRKCFGKSNRENWRILVIDKFAMRIVSACLRMHDLTEEGITCKYICLHNKNTFYLKIVHL